MHSKHSRSFHILESTIHRATQSVADRLFSTDADRSVRQLWASRTALGIAKSLGFTANGGSDYSVKNVFANLITSDWVRSIDMSDTQSLFAIDNSVYGQIQPLSSTHVQAAAIVALHDAILRHIIFLPCDVWHEWQMALGPRHSFKFSGIWAPHALEPGGLRVVYMDQERMASNNNVKLGSHKMQAWNMIARGRSLITRIITEEGIVVSTDIPEFGKGLHEFSAEFVDTVATVPTLVLFVTMMKRYGIITEFMDLTNNIQGSDLGFGDASELLAGLDAKLLQSFDPVHITSRSMAKNAGPGLYADIGICTSMFNPAFVPLAHDRQGIVLYSFEPEAAPEDVGDLADYHLQNVLTMERGVGVYYDVLGKPSGVFYGIPAGIASNMFTRGLVAMTYAHTLYRHSKHPVTYKTGPVHAQQLISDPAIVAELYKQWW